MRILFSVRGAILVVLFFTANLSAVAQGSLTPPGAPAPTMRTLQQVEPRIPISSSPFSITNGGSYYLTTNLPVTSGNAVIINANNVTLDLNGFTISSSEPNADPSGTGVLLVNSNAVPGQAGLRNIFIFNGSITGSFTNNGGIWMGAGFNSGINYSGSVAPVNVHVRDVSVFGCFNYGILIGASSSVVESCVVQSVGTFGIYANNICRSSATFCGNHAMVGNAVSECYGQCIGSGDGIYCSTANNCTGISQSGDGLYAANAATCCFGQSATGPGVYTLGAATGCYGWSTSNAGASEGMVAVTAENCYGEADGNGDGIYSAGVAASCRGRASGNGAGIRGSCANTCSGDSQNGYGMDVLIAIGCFGSSSTTTNNLRAFIGNSSYGNSGSEQVIYKYNMP